MMEFGFSDSQENKPKSKDQGELSAIDILLLANHNVESSPSSNWPLILMFNGRFRKFLTFFLPNNTALKKSKAVSE